MLVFEATEDVLIVIIVGGFSRCRVGCRDYQMAFETSGLCEKFNFFCKDRQINMPNLVERGLASNPKMEYQVFLCIFQKNSAMATYGLKEMGKFLWEGREKGV